ncbi:MAG TPA: SGNH/GDSL hydrolase family protein [Thermoanaerobaculia bacterium]|nr:SGNH/GDSL hydrolase family protein [Thermoanaerobaculia bacterium]
MARSVGAPVTSPARVALFTGVFMVLSLLIALAAGEIFVRAGGRTDADGTFFFRDRPIPPFALPVKHARALIDEYLRDPTGYMLYDPDLGWTNRPGACTPDRLYCANWAGLRADREYAKSPPDGTLRVSLFGDSFVFGHNVELPGSLAPQLETALSRRGVRAEALNFGVGGYGMDQAYLRYTREGTKFESDVIVEGLQLENVARHLMVFRIIAYPQSKIPFSKPRYYMEGPSLLAVNRPTVAPDLVPHTLATFHRSLLRRYDVFYTDKYVPRWYRYSRLIAVLEDARARGHDEVVDLMSPQSEGMRVTTAILERFRSDVAVTRKPFLLVYLPLPGNLQAQLDGGKDPWEPIVTSLRSSFTIVDPTPRLLDIARRKGVGAVAPGHYSAEGNGAVAETIAEAIVELRR